MKISDKQLRKIIREEFEQTMKEEDMDEGMFDKIGQKVKGFFGAGGKGSQARGQPLQRVSGSGVKFTPPVEDATGEPAVAPGAQPAQPAAAPAQPAAAPAQPAAAPAQPAAAPAAPAAPAEVPAAQNPKLMKRMELFKQNMPQYFQAIQKKIADVIKGAVSANVQQIKEAADPSSVISSLISKELNNALAGALKTVTPEDFLKAYQMVAKKNIKDPKQLAQSLKNFRGLEEQETVDVNPLAGTEMDLFDAVLQAKRIGISSLVKQAAEKASANPQVQRYMPPEQATKVVASLTSAARTVRQLLAMNPASTAQTIAKSAPAGTPPAQPAAQPKAAAPAKKPAKKPAAPAKRPAKKPAAQAQQSSPVAESYKATYDKWKKIIKG